MLVMTHADLPDDKQRNDHRGGWTGALEHLARLVERKDTNPENRRST